MFKQSCAFVQELARQSGVRNLSVYICNFDLPLQDIRAGRVPPVPLHLLTVMQVTNNIYIYITIFYIDIIYIELILELFNIIYIISSYNIRIIYIHV